jgi:hypothetical protein
MSVRVLPLFPLGSVLFPGGPLSLRIFEPRYVDMVGRCLKEGTGFVVCLLVTGREVGAAPTQAAAIGTEARVVDFDRLQDGLLGLTCRGLGRVRIERSWREPDGLNMGEVHDIPADPTVPVPPEAEPLREVLRQLYPEIGEPYVSLPTRWDDAGWVANRLAEIAPLERALRQRLLEMTDPLERIRALMPLIRASKLDA